MHILHSFDINGTEQQQDKKIEQIDPNTLKVIATYSSIGEAANSLHLNRSAISMAISGTHKTSGGYYWRETGSKKEFHQTNTTKQWTKKVQKLDKETEEILEEFNSLADAARSLGKDGKNGGSSIGAVCRGTKKSAFGYKWKYSESK